MVQGNVPNRGRAQGGGTNGNIISKRSSEGIEAASVAANYRQSIQACVGSTVAAGQRHAVPMYLKLTHRASFAACNEDCNVLSRSMVPGVYLPSKCLLPQQCQ